MKYRCKFLGGCKNQFPESCSNCSHQYDSNYVSNFNYKTGRKYGAKKE